MLTVIDNKTLTLYLKKNCISEVEFAKIRTLGIIDEYALRDVIIRFEFWNKKNTNIEKYCRPLSGGIIKELSAKYYIDKKALNKIIYGKSTKKRGKII